MHNASEETTSGKDGTNERWRDDVERRASDGHDERKRAKCSYLLSICASLPETRAAANCSSSNMAFATDDSVNSSIIASFLILLINFTFFFIK